MGSTDYELKHEQDRQRRFGIESWTGYDGSNMGRVSEKSKEALEADVVINIFGTGDVAAPWPAGTDGQTVTWHPKQMESPVVKFIQHVCPPEVSLPRIVGMSSSCILAFPRSEPSVFCCFCLAPMPDEAERPEADARRQEERTRQVFEEAFEQQLQQSWHSQFPAQRAEPSSRDSRGSRQQSGKRPSYSRHS